MKETYKWCLVSKSMRRHALFPWLRPRESSAHLYLLDSTVLSPTPLRRPVRRRRRVARCHPPRTPVRSRDIPRALARVPTNTGSRRRTQTRRRGPDSPELRHTRDMRPNRSGFHILPVRLVGAPEGAAGAAAGTSSTMTPPGLGWNDIEGFASFVTGHMLCKTRTSTYPRISTEVRTRFRPRETRTFNDEQQIGSNQRT